MDFDYLKLITGVNYDQKLPRSRYTLDRNKSNWFFFCFRQRFPMRKPIEGRTSMKHFIRSGTKMIVLEKALRELTDDEDRDEDWAWDCWWRRRSKRVLSLELIRTFSDLIYREDQVQLVVVVDSEWNPTMYIDNNSLDRRTYWTSSNRWASTTKCWQDFVIVRRWGDGSCTIGTNTTNSIVTGHLKNTTINQWRNQKRRFSDCRPDLSSYIVSNLVCRSK